ncbi:MAG: phage tail fiber protein [Comamonas sp.]|jgi:hypothetical protein|uniref:phage tail fiber protein n=1 Tax=Comamonas TaxID=283 RepID=UPI0015F8B370|nr:MULTISPECIES: hypothetical protein [Comamonas]
MSGFSTYAANATANFWCKGIAMPGVPGRYLALFKADPTDSFTAGTEVTGSWYTRIQAPTFATANNGSTFNTERAEFAPVTGAAVTVTHIGVVDALTGGNLIFSEALPAPKLLNINDVYFIDSSQLSGDLMLNFL